MGKGKPKVSPVDPASPPPLEIDAAQIRKGSWKLWEWLSDETPIEFIDEILIEVLPLIVGEIIILHRKEVGL